MSTDAEKTGGGDLLKNVVTEATKPAVHLEVRGPDGHNLADTVLKIFQQIAARKESDSE